MNLLEAFYYTFAADASKLDKGLTESEKKTKDLQDAVSKTDAATEKLGGSFLALAKAGVGLLGVTATLGGIKMLALGTAETTSELGKQARQMNLNVSTLDAWRKAVTESGGDANAFTGTLGKLAQRFRDPEAALLRYSKALGGMSAFRAQRLGKMIGLDESTIELLRKGKIGVEELIKKQKEQGVITKEQVEMTDKFNQDLRTLKMSFGDIKTQLGMMLIPVLQKMLDKWNSLSAWTKDNKPLITGFFTAIAGIITALYLPAMLRAVVATYALLAPYLLIIGAVLAVAAAFAIAYDDVMNFLAGNDSVIGELSKKWPLIGELVRGLVAELKSLWAQIIAVGDALVMMVTNPVQFFKNLGTEIKALLDLLFGEGVGDSVFSTVAKEASAIWQSLEKLINGVVRMAIDGFRRIEDAWGAVKTFFGAGDEDIEKAKNTSAAIGSEQGYASPERLTYQEWVTPPDRTYGGQDILAQAAHSSIPTMTSNSIANSRQQTNKTNHFNFDSITVETRVTDAQGVAQGLAGELKGAFRQFDNGEAV